MFKPETIAKAVKLLNESIAVYRAMPTDAYKLCISSGNMKIGKVLNVSLAPLISCGNCSLCAGYCYDVKAVMAYPSCRDARARNMALLLENRDEYFRRIREKLAHAKRKNKFFRWHVSGDIYDPDYLDRMCQIARAFPEWTFWTYTKMYHLVNSYVDAHGGSREAAIPSNLAIMFSKWDGVDMPNPHGFPVFACEMPEDIARDVAPSTYIRHRCPGNCDTCIKAKRGCVVGESTYTDLH